MGLLCAVALIAGRTGPAAAEGGKAVLLDVDSGYANASALAVAPGVIVGAAAPEGGPYGPATWTGSSHRFGAINYDHVARAALLRATDGTQHTGMLFYFSGNTGIERTEAAMWDAAGQHRLHQAGWEYSDAYAVAGGEQGGVATDATGRSRATIWAGTPESARSLDPAGAGGSTIFGMAIGVQVGAVAVQIGPGRFAAHAGIWSGSAESFVDLHPAWALGSELRATDGAQHAGFVTRDDGVRGAAVWSGGSPEPIDLRPPGFAESEARGVRGGTIVGFATAADGLPHALAWRSGGAVIDLHAQLPTGLLLSYAYSVDDEGSVVGEAMGPEWGEWHAVLWKVAIDAVRLSDFMPPLEGPRNDKVAAYGSVVPVKLQARNGDKAPIRGLAIELTVVELGPAGTPSNSGPVVIDTVMLEDNGVYDYNLDTTGLRRGYRYRLIAKVPGSTVPRSADLTVE